MNRRRLRLLALQLGLAALLGGWAGTDTGLAGATCPVGCCTGEHCENPEDHYCCGPEPGEAACSSTCSGYCFPERCIPTPPG